jgi:glycerol-3-phosphate acyltransferase PlsX
VSEPVTVALDAMGGDHAPAETVAGAVLAASTGEVRVLLCGQRAPILQELGGSLPPGIDIVDAPQIIGYEEEPAYAVRAKQDSSLVTACRAVREGGAVAAVSGGSTGAMMAASLVEMRRIPGVLRPAIACAVPSSRGPVVLVDCGANSDSKPDHLLQFAYMGAAFASGILGIENPRVGLLSIGEEAGKGNLLTQEAHSLLAAADGLDFYGNVEGRDILKGTTEVVVTDGFTGNVCLKLLEGAGMFVVEEIRAAAGSSIKARIGATLLKPSLRPFQRKADPEAYGGAYLVGLRGIAVIAHGASSRIAIRNAILYGANGARNDVVGRLSERLARQASTVSTA